MVAGSIFCVLLLLASAASTNAADFPYSWINFVGQPGGQGNADGAGSAARFRQPSGVAVDSAGNVFVADYYNQTIRKVTSGGVVTTLAGSTGNGGSNDGTGSAARFFFPSGVAVDSAGNVFVADTYNYTIRKVTPAGVVTTLAGSAGNSGSNDGTGNAARFNHPSSVAVDSAGNLYVADTWNHTIRKVTPAGVVTTLAGSAGNSGSNDGTGSAARFSGLNGVAVDSAGNLYVADTDNYTIRKVTPTGVVTTLAGSAAQFGQPCGVAVDSAGNVFVADTYNYTIRKVTPAGVVTTLAGSAGNSGSNDGTGSAARFSDPHGVAVDSAGNVFVADTWNHAIRKVTPAGVVTTLAGSAGNSGSNDGVGSVARFSGPEGVAVDSVGNVYVADQYNYTIRKVTPTGVVTTLAGSAGNSGSNDGTGSAARFAQPSCVAVDSAGNVYVADADNHTIRKVTPAGVVTTLAGSAGNSGSNDGTGSAARFNLPYGVAVDSEGNVFVADYWSQTIRKVTQGGVVTTLAGNPGVSGSSDGTGNAAQFYYPSGVAVDGAGNVYVADALNRTIRKVTPAGVVTTLAGSAGNRGSNDGMGSAARFAQPSGVAVDSAGNLYVADSGNSAIRKVTPVGVVTTLGGRAGSSGSADGTGSAAQFSNPDGVAVDSAGTIYVADSYNNRISKGLLLAPKIVVEQPAGTGFASGSTQSYGTVLAGATKLRTFLLKNTGTANLTSVSLSITGAGASSYAVTASPAASVVPGDSTAFTVSFAPGSSGLKAATLHIASNSDPFDINLTGIGSTTLAASYTTGAEIPAAANGFTATGKTVNCSLSYAPSSGTSLMVLNNTGPGFINGAFSNLAHGQAVALSFNGATYKFIANYYGGSGNDLVLQWAGTRLLAWGVNDSGTLGNNSRTGSKIPVPVIMSGVLAGKTITAVAVAQNHSIALCSDGTVAAWGANASGQLGNNSTTDSLTPVQVNASAGSALSGKTVVAIAAGCDFSMALCSDGTVAAWGLNGSGQLGDNTWTNRSLPVNALAGSALNGKTVASIAAGYDFCLARCSDGSVAGWGANSCGQLGNNSTADSPVPVAVSSSAVLSGKAVTAVAAGHYHSLAVCTDGTLAAWGDNSLGELGNNSTDSSLVPVLVNSGGALFGKIPVSVSAGQFHSVALCADGTLATWGDNSSGQLGISGPGSPVPVAVNASGALSGKAVVSVVAGQTHNVALLADGTLAAWGENASGQLGNNSNSASSLPVAVNTAALAAGERIINVAGGPTASHGISVVAIPLSSLAGPSVTTNPATDLTTTSATLHGLANPNGLATDVCFEFGPTTGYGNSTTSQSIGNGNSDVNMQASLSGLQPNTTYHFRIKATNTSGTALGGDATFTTVADPPSAVTNNATSITATNATLTGVVNPKGRATSVQFEYGLTPSLGNSTPAQNLTAGASNVEVTAPIAGLSPGTTYYFRIVATNAGGSASGNIGSFAAATTGGIPTAPPSVTTGGTTNVTTAGATLQGTVNPNGGITNAWFEYGMTTGYGGTTSNLGAGSGATPGSLSADLTGLQSGTLYHYRLVAQNSLGTTPGPDTTFTTLFLPPAATTGGSALLSTTSVRVSGTVRAHNASTQVFFDYGTDGVNFPNSVSANPASVTGDTDTAVTGDLPNLLQGTTYSYRVRATSVGGTTTGATNSFNVAILSGLAQVFPPAPPAASGNVTVNLVPSGINSGWRFVGEQQWRASGLPVGGLTTGDRQIEFRPVPGYIQPLKETISVISGGAATLVTGQYYPTPGSATGGMSVVLKPDALADAGLPVDQRAQWRFLGEDDTHWRNSGVTVGELPAGNYLVESKPVTGRATPAVINVTVDSGATKVATATYYLASATTGTAPSVVSFDTVSTSQTLPYAYVGQIRSDLGSATGFVVKPRVVATAAHVVFDDGTLSYVSSLQWLFQRDRGTYEPTPQIPRGFYVFDGYAAQRTADATPGVSTPQSQNLDAAALFFTDGDAGRGGYGGYLASDLDNNEFLLSTKMKMLVGYPVDGIVTLKQGRMHATPAANITFAKAFGRTFTTSDIRSAGGNSGGPLCVQADNGNYYPAAIYLGGSGQTVVRAIDSQVIDLFNRAEVSANGGDDQLGGGPISIRPPAIAPPPAPASLAVSIEPAGAVAAGATWNVGGASGGSGASASLPAGTYTLTCSGVVGFLAPAPTTITLSSGEGRSIPITYSGITAHPAGLTAATGGNATFSVGVSGTPSAYQWRRNGTDIPGATSSTYTRSNLTATDTGNYSVVVTWGGSGSLTSNAAALDVTAASGFDAWRAQKFTATELLDALKSGPTADYDHDGVCNLLEYALNLDPKTADTTTMIAGTGTSGLPLVRVEIIGGQNRLTVEFVRRKAASTPGITYAVEFSSGLSNGWSSTGTETTTPIDTTWERVKTTDQQSSSPYRFTRLKVTQP